VGEGSQKGILVHLGGGNRNLLVSEQRTIDPGPEGRLCRAKKGEDCRLTSLSQMSLKEMSGKKTTETEKEQTLAMS